MGCSLAGALPQVKTRLTRLGSTERNVKIFFQKFGSVMCKCLFGSGPGMVVMDHFGSWVRPTEPHYIGPPNRPASSANLLTCRVLNCRSVRSGLGPRCSRRAVSCMGQCRGPVGGLGLRPEFLLVLGVCGPARHSAKISKFSADLN